MVGDKLKVAGSGTADNRGAAVAGVLPPVWARRRHSRAERDFSSSPTISLSSAPRRPALRKLNDGRVQDGTSSVA